MGRIAKYAAVAAVSLAAGALLGWFGRDWAGAPANLLTVAYYDDWRLICPPLQRADPSCEMRQDLVDSKSRAEVAHLMLTDRNGAGLLAITVPYDVLVQPGVGLSLDNGKVHAYPFQTCDTVGCVARIPVDEDLRKSLLAARQGRLLFAGLNKKVIALSFSLRGFPGAEAAFAVGRGRHQFLGMTFGK